jgi:hypothetical protein
MMKNFIPIATVDVQPLVDALNQYPEMWNQNTLRTTHFMSPHTEVQDIWIRFNKIESDATRQSLLDDNESIWYGSAGPLPIREIIYPLMHDVFADRLGRVIITKMAPGTKITPHADMGGPATYYQRFHVALQSKDGQVFKCGDEEFTPETGLVYAVNNALEHSVENNSDIDRLTMIIDLRTALLEDLKKTQGD